LNGDQKQKRENLRGKCYAKSHRLANGILEKRHCRYRI
jgi:hypothetical protein